MPLKRDYAILLNEFKKKSEVVNLLDMKLREIENQQYGGQVGVGVVKGVKKGSKVWRM